MEPSSLSSRPGAWSSLCDQYKLLDFWEISALLQYDEVASEGINADALKNDDELNRMVARVCSDGTLDREDEFEVKESDPCTDPETELTQFSFDDECEKLKSLLRKSKESYESEFVGSVATAVYPGDASAAPPSDSGASKEDAMVGDHPAPSFNLAPGKEDTLIMRKEDTLIVRAENQMELAQGFNPIASSQLFAGAPLFAFPHPRLDAFDEFRRNGHDAGSPSPFVDASGSPWTPSRTPRGCGDGGSGEEVSHLLPSEVANRIVGAGEGVLQKPHSEKPFSWANVTKKGADTKVDVAAEQRLCRILEKFIEEFNCTYEEARALLELMQEMKSVSLTSGPLPSVVDAARELMAQSPLAVTQAALAAERETAAKRAANVEPKPSLNPAKAMAQLREEELPWNYKTVMCNFFKEGTCRLGNKCMFAHSKAELREPIIPNGYCIAFVTKGVCKWGSTCNYVHEIPSLSRKQNQSSEKIKLIKAPEPKGPHIPVGLNYVSGSGRAGGVVAASPTVITPTPTVNGEALITLAESKAKAKTKKEKDEWSTVARGPKPGVKGPEFRSPSAIINAFAADNLCVLCREQVSSSNHRIKLDCGHSEFHRGCIKDWLKSHNPPICPVCRATAKALPELDDAADLKKKKP